MPPYHEQVDQAGDNEGFVVAPLIEAAIEVRFPGDTRVERWRDELQQKIRHDFPMLLVPPAQEGVAPALQHYVFASEDQSKSVGLSINSLVFTTKAYGGWVEFKKDFLKYWFLLAKALAPEKVNRVGMFYLNRFEDAKLKDVFSKLNLQSNQFSLLSENTQNHQSTNTVRHDNFWLNTQVMLVRDNTHSVIQVRYDAFCPVPTSPDDLESTIESLHRIIESEFFKDIAPTLAEGLMPPEVD